MISRRTVGWLSANDGQIIRRWLADWNFMFDKINQARFVFIVTARVMLLFVFAQQVWRFCVLTRFCDVIFCCCLQSVMVYCFDLVWWCYCLLLLAKCDSLVFWPDFVRLFIVIAQKLWCFSVLTWFRDVIVCFDLILCCCFFLLLRKCDGLGFRHDLVMPLIVVAHKVWGFSYLAWFCDAILCYCSHFVVV